MVLQQNTRGPKLHHQRVGGATVLTIQEPSLPVVRFLFASRRGAAWDPPGLAGLTRTTTELCLRGTEKRNRVEFNAELERMGSHLFAMTGKELSVIRGGALSRNLSVTLALAGEALAEPGFRQAELDPLLAETSDGLRAARDDDDTLAELFLRRALYGQHPLATSPQGEVADLARIDSDRVRQAWSRLVQPSDLIVALAGDIDPERARQEVGALFEALPSGSETLPELAPVTNPPGMQILVVDKPGLAQVQLRLARSVVSGQHPDSLAFWLATTAFGGTFTSPFCREVRDERGWSYVASASFDPRGLFRAPLVLRSVPSMEDALDCLDLELDLYRGLAGGGIEDATLEFARTYMLNRYPLEMAGINEVMFGAVRNERLGRAPDEIFTLPDRLSKLDLEEAHEALKRHLDPGSIVVVLVATADRLVPGLRQRYPDAQLDVVDYRDGLGLEEMT